MSNVIDKEKETIFAAEMRERGGCPFFVCFIHAG